MRTVYKYPLKWQSDFEVVMPVGAQILHVDEQDGEPYLWAFVDTENPDSIRRFGIFGTGQPFPGENDFQLPFRHITTFLSLGGVLVWHVFEVGYSGDGIDTYVTANPPIPDWPEALGAQVGGTVRTSFEWKCVCGEGGRAADEQAASRALYAHRQMWHTDPKGT